MQELPFVIVKYGNEYEYDPQEEAGKVAFLGVMNFAPSPYSGAIENVWRLNRERSQEDLTAGVFYAVLQVLPVPPAP